MTKTTATTTSQDVQSAVISKLPAITAAFWIMKISATTLGETAGDLLSMTLKVGYAASCVILLSCFLVLLVIQLRDKTHHPFLYWGVILATSTAGTTISDFIDRTLHLGYPLGATLLATLLVTTLLVWRFSTGSISVTNVRTTGQECFYWTAILISNTLGTALGDFLADSSGLGFFGSNMLISALLLLTLAGRYFTKFSRVTLFWIAFVLTRPFGATMGDLLTKDHSHGGLGFGTIGSSIVLLAILVFFVLRSRSEHAAGNAGIK
jgi:uncharacterized membrane-anchored protein